MKLIAWLATALGAKCLGEAYSIAGDVRAEAVNDLVNVKRTLPNSPNGYTPSRVSCSASRPSVRSAASLSPNETSWLHTRRGNTVPAMRKLLKRLNVIGFDAEAYIDNHFSNSSMLPNIAIGTSSGGWRALMVGAGVLQAFDSRTANSTNTGQLGGLLQSATYLAGLSGGSWLVGSIYVNNFTTVSALRDNTDGSLWGFGNSVLEGLDEGGLQILNSASYYTALIEEVDDKGDAGFDTTITDMWGRALSFQLINATNGGPYYTWSSIALAENFRNGETPFPIIIVDERAPGEVLIPTNTTNYEFNPFEMGSFDPTVFSFVPTKYLGSNFSEGSLPSNEECVIGFDNAGYVMGTSSSLFNQILTDLNSTSLPNLFKDFTSKLLAALGEDNNDIAKYAPNPFYRYNLAINPNANTSSLTLVNGGEDGQNIPLNPLIQPHRNVDVIFAINVSPRTRPTPGRSEACQNTFVNLGLNTRPTFFGCNASNITGTHTVPLIVYIPNSPYVYNSNISTFQLSTNDTQRDAIILNGYNVATMGNGTIGSDWAMCAGCAILKRSFGRTGTTVPDACTKCYDEYCWDGTLNSTTPASYDPTPAIAKVESTSAAPSLASLPSTLAAVVIFAVAAALLP